MKLVIALVFFLFFSKLGFGQQSKLNTQFKNDNKYSFLCSDYSGGKVCIVDTSGKIIWEYPAKNSNDVWMLNNGNILFNDGNTVKEVTRNKKIVFEYKSTGEIFAFSVCKMAILLLANVTGADYWKFRPKVIF